MLAAIDKSDLGRPKALARLGEAFAELSKNHRERAIAADPNAATRITSYNVCYTKLLRSIQEFLNLLVHLRMKL